MLQSQANLKKKKFFAVIKKNFKLIILINCLSVGAITSKSDLLFLNPTPIATAKSCIYLLCKSKPKPKPTNPIFFPIKKNTCNTP